MPPTRIFSRAVPCAARWFARIAARSVALVLACTASLGAQQAQPDVFLVPVRIANRQVQLGTPRNVTARTGYDNQPSFSADSRALYYTSTREDAQADIYRIDVASGRERRVTTTDPESEYSATEMPGGGAISVIRVERDSAQRLWRLPLVGGTESVIFPTLRPVGYHAWANAQRLVMFVLGSPNALVLGDRTTGALDTITASVGRSMHRIPGTEHVSFTRRLNDSTWIVMALDVQSRATRELARLPVGVEDYAWLPDGRIIAGQGSALRLRDPAQPGEWTSLADLGGAGLASISRLAVSPDGAWLAIVAVPVAPTRSDAGTRSATSSSPSSGSTTSGRP